MGGGGDQARVLSLHNNTITSHCMSCKTLYNQPNENASNNEMK